MSAILAAASVPAAGRRAADDLAVEQLPHVYRFLLARIGNRADAEDLIQQVVVRALPRLDAAYSAESVRAYLFATARTVLAEYWTERLRLPVEQLREEVRESRRSELRERPELSRNVIALLSALRPQYRQLLELRYLRGYTVKEVAAEMGKSSGAVKVMQNRALTAAAAVSKRSASGLA